MKTIVAMSDTHGRHAGLKVPDGDILIHAGDFCRYGSRADVHEFGEWFSAFPHKYKIAIAGNHDLALEKWRGYGLQLRHHGIEYLEDSWTKFDGGPKIYGSPWTLPFQDWAFMLEEKELMEKYSLIPNDVDVLITHGGPAGVLDLTDLEGIHAGSAALMAGVSRIFVDRPLVHIFGHIHERHGQFELEPNYRAFNVSICDFKYNVAWEPTVIEI